MLVYKVHTENPKHSREVTSCWPVHQLEFTCDWDLYPMRVIGDYWGEDLIMVGLSQGQFRNP